jgi:hypothetical protein
LVTQLRLFTAAADIPNIPGVACALASMDRNGYVRERSVRAMGRQAVPEFEPVRRAALEVLRDLVAAEPKACRGRWCGRARGSSAATTPPRCWR